MKRLSIFISVLALYSHAAHSQEDNTAKNPKTQVTTNNKANQNNSNYSPTNDPRHHVTVRNRNDSTSVLPPVKEIRTNRIYAHSDTIRKK